MNPLKSETSPRKDDGHIRDIVRGKAVSMPEFRAEGGPHLSSDTIGPLVQKAGATTIAEIDNLISELQAARNYLKSEADRIQRELTRYTQLSDTASASVKTITQSLGQWRNANDAERNGASEGQVSPPAET